MHYGEFDYVVVNEHFAVAVDEMCAIFTASACVAIMQVARHSRLITALVASSIPAASCRGQRRDR